MGDRIEIEKIEFLYGRLWQIDLYNVTKKEHYRFFVEETQLAQLQSEARQNYAKRLERKTAFDLASWFEGCKTENEWFERLNQFVKYYQLSIAEGFENLKKWNEENKKNDEQ